MPIFQFYHFHLNGMEWNAMWKNIYSICLHYFKPTNRNESNLFFVVLFPLFCTVFLCQNELSLKPHRAQRKWYGQVINPFTVGKQGKQKPVLKWYKREKFTLWKFFGTRWDLHLFECEFQVCGQQVRLYPIPPFPVHFKFLHIHWIDIE